jgi:glutathione S-transferase
MARLREMLDRMEASLADQDWLADDNLTLADSAMAAIMLRLHEFGLAAAWESRLPRVADWWQRLAARPSMRQLIDLADPALLAELTGSVEKDRPWLLARLS